VDHKGRTGLLTRHGWVLGLLVLSACGGRTDEADSTEGQTEAVEQNAAAAEAPFRTGNEDASHLILEEEKHFGSLTQLTFGGQNAEAYWSTDDEWIMFQATPRDAQCDQQFTMRPDGSELSLVSTGVGRTTCGYFFPGNDKIVYGSTHLGGEECPPEADMSQGYVWALYEDYDIFVADADGSNLTRITDTPVYDAEATVSRDGEWVVFTSARDGDLDIYKMRIDGSEVTRLTDTPGYDGGPFFSYDGTKIIYRASHPEGDELADYQRLLAQGLIRPSQLDIFVMDADGSNKVQITDNGAANFGPYMFPDGQRIIFSSNLGDPSGREFDLWAINIDGSGLEQITFSGDFDGFPMFNSDGSKLIFASNRGNELPRETNLFIADWVD
jgi:Tol biopolymer transport system component